MKTKTGVFSLNIGKTTFYFLQETAKEVGEVLISNDLSYLGQLAVLEMKLNDEGYGVCIASVYEGVDCPYRLFKYLKGEVYGS